MAAAEATHALSVAAACIQDFWSHSWSADARQKVLMLILLYNSVPAIVISTLAVFVTFCLSGLNILPPMVTRLTLFGDHFWFSVWSMLFGCTAFVVALFA